MLSRSQDDGSRFRHDGPLVQHGRTGEHGVAPVGDSDTTLIDDCPEFGSGQPEIVIAAQEVLIAYVECRCDQSTHVHSGARAKQYSVGIDEPDVAVGFERPENGRGVDSGDPVEKNGERAGLQDANGLAWSDGKALPVDNGLVGQLLDLGVRAGRDIDLAVADGGSARIAESDSGKAEGE